jgi:hypothetical protein
MDVLIIMSWTIWMARNDLFFKGINPTLHAAQERFKEFALVILRAKESNKPHMHLWLQSICNLSNFFPFFFCFYLLKPFCFSLIYNQ